MQIISNDNVENLVTTSYRFVINMQEQDENSAVRVYDYDGKLISDNYFAAELALVILAGQREGEDILRISEELEELRQQQIKISKDNI